MLHQAVREGWPSVAESLRLPPRVHEEVRRCPGCSNVRRGFTVVKCDDCARSELVAFPILTCGPPSPRLPEKEVPSQLANDTVLHLTIAPEWTGLKETWDECRAFFAAAGLDDEQTQSLAMAAQELLENAVKYGHFSGREQIDLRITRGAAHVTIEVRNPASADAQQLRSLDDMIQWIRGFQNPFEAYVERLKLLAAQPYQPGVSGLGLVRIAYEAQCVLDFYVDDANQLALSAVYSAAPGAA